MHGTRSWSGAVLAAALGTLLVLPPPGTESRARRFCSAWNDLDKGQKQDVIVRAEKAEIAPALEDACRAGLRPALRHTLDFECGNRKRPMDFEIRAVVDGILASCRSEPG